MTKDKVVQYIREEYSPLVHDGVTWVWGYATAAVEMARIYVEMPVEMPGTAHVLMTVAIWLRGEAAVQSKWGVPCARVSEYAS